MITTNKWQRQDLGPDLQREVPVHSILENLLDASLLTKCKTSSPQCLWTRWSSSMPSSEGKYHRWHAGNPDFTLNAYADTLIV